jgi:hypothetical protein
MSPTGVMALFIMACPGSTQISRNYTLATGLFNDEFHVFSLNGNKTR